MQLCLHCSLVHGMQESVELPEPDMEREGAPLGEPHVNVEWTETKEKQH